MKQSFSGLLLCALLLPACSRDTEMSGLSAPITPKASAMMPPVRDSVMGRFSAIAQAISAGLQNPLVRTQLLQALMDKRANPTGVDLQSCEDGGVVQQLFDIAGQRGFQGGASLCAMVAKFDGLTLYMDRDRLAHWSPTVVPIVTAIANPEKTLPARLVGYRSPSRTMAFANESSYVGPVLVILPFAHAHRVASHGRSVMKVETLRNQPTTPDQTERKQ